MKKRLAAMALAGALFFLSACSAGSHMEALPEKLTAEPVSREMVELVRGLHSKS